MLTVVCGVNLQQKVVPPVSAHYYKCGERAQHVSFVFHVYLSLPNVRLRHVPTLCADSSKAPDSHPRALCLHWTCSSVPHAVRRLPAPQCLTKACVSMCLLAHQILEDNNKGCVCSRQWKSPQARLCCGRIIAQEVTRALSPQGKHMHNTPLFWITKQRLAKILLINFLLN